MKLGLVMEGGAMRGMFTAGVLDVLMKNQITFDGAVGVSAGATFGCNIKSEQIGRAIRYNRKYCKNWRYGSMRSFLRSGNMFDYNFCYHLLPEKLDPFDTETFAKNPMDFYVVATDLESGRPAYKLLTDGKGKDLAWIAASASMPLVSRTIILDGHKYLDGGITDSIPLAFFESIGYERNVVIETRPDSYVKKKSEMMAAARLRYKAYPNFVEAMENRPQMYNQETAYVREAEKDGRAFVIRPPEALNISATTTDPKELQRVYLIGKREATKALPALHEFLLASGHNYTKVPCDVSPESTPELPQEHSQSDAQEHSQNTIQEPLPDAAQEYSQNAARECIQEDPQEPSQDSALSEEV